MRIQFAHLREQAQDGSWVNFVVFNAKSITGQLDDLLGTLTRSVRENGLKVDQSALAFKEGNNIKFHGTPSLVRFLLRRGVPRWTHTLVV